MTDIPTDRGLSQAGAATRGVAGMLSRPRAVAAACIVLLAGSGWLCLGLLAAYAPGDGYLAALCRPLGSGAAFGMREFALIALMWTAMTLAMMLPSAGPMVLTYAEIAETAARKGERIVSPLVLAAGYCTVWLGFAAYAAFLQFGLVRLVPIRAEFSVPLSAALFVGAGLYQFSAMKQACLSVCQQPFPFFFTNWTERAGGVFRLGLRQGLHCLGCCWAMMLLMFAAGAMNVAWMAALGLVMVIEKMSQTARFSYAVGVLFVLAGLALAVAWIAGSQMLS